MSIKKVWCIFLKDDKGNIHLGTVQSTQTISNGHIEWYHSRGFKVAVVSSPINDILDVNLDNLIFN